jgi:predicted CoA-binding protein
MVTDMRAAAKTFFTAKQFAVAGASSNTAKFGYKLFVWYQDHDLKVIPLNPSSSSVAVGNKEFDTVASPSKITDPTNTSLSIVTPPAVTAKLLEEAKAAGIKAVWLQPGTYTDKEFDYAMKEFPGAAVGGHGNGTVGGEGWCVLVDGDEAIDAASKSGKL